MASSEASKMDVCWAAGSRSAAHGWWWADGGTKEAAMRACVCGREREEGKEREGAKGEGRARSRPPLLKGREGSTASPSCPRSPTARRRASALAEKGEGADGACLPARRARPARPFAPLVPGVPGGGATGGPVPTDPRSTCPAWPKRPGQGARRRGTPALLPPSVERSDRRTGGDGWPRDGGPARRSPG